MQHQRINGIVGMQGIGWLLHRQFQNTTHLLLGGHDFSHRRALPRRVNGGGRCGLHRVKKIQQFARTVVLHAHGSEHRHAKLRRQTFPIHHNAFVRSSVTHVEHQCQGQVQCTGFQHQTQVQAQIGGIHHAQHQIRQTFLGTLTGDDVAGDLFVGTHGIQAVRTGQIQHHHLSTISGLQVTFFALDRDTGVICHFLPTAGEQIEQRCFAAIRVAQQGYAQGGRCRGLVGHARHAATPCRPAVTRT